MSHWQNVIKKTLTFSRDNQLLAQGRSLIVGLSGGPDSVFLSRYLASKAAEMSFECHLAHVNYGLRGEDSEADESFCRELAENLGWPISVLRCNEDDRQAAAGQNLQAWAREKRYAFFCDISRRVSRPTIVVAHHLSDQIETFLLRMLRGSGPSGLVAMRPRTVYEGVTLVRPLLCLTGHEIRQALEEQGIAYRSDSSNDSDRYRRNRLRKRIVPELLEIEPKFEQLAGEALFLWQEEDTLLQNMARQQLSELKLADRGEDKKTLRIPRQGLKRLPAALRLRILREMIAELTEGPQSITFHHVRKIDALVCHGPKRARYDLPEQVLFEQGPIVVSLTNGRKALKN